MLSVSMYQPVDDSLSGQHQVVTAAGESSFLYGNKHQPIIIDDDEEDFPAKRFPIQKAGKNTPFIKPAQLKLAEIDVTKGDISPLSSTSLVSLKDRKNKSADKGIEKSDERKTKQNFGKSSKSLSQEHEEADLGEDDNDINNLNIQLRENAWNNAIIKSGKVTHGVRADNSAFPDSICLQDDNFRDFDHLDSRLYDEFVKGYVVLGSNRGVSTLLNNHKNLSVGTHGVIVERRLIPSFDGLFEEGECSQFTIQRELGRGSFGTVSYCKHRDGHEYVKKVISAKFSKKEVEVLMQLSHPNITSFYGYILRDGNHEIMMEYGGLSLKTLMDKIRPQFKATLTYDLVKKLTLQGFLALDYMYQHFGILHLDIKPENVCILLEQEQLKITDFGTSKTPQQAISFDGWTPEYMSPEACRLLMAPKMQNLPQGFVEDLTGKTDVFAFGLVVCFMLTGNHTVCKFWPPEFTREFTFSMWRGQYIVMLAQNVNFIKTVAVEDDWPKEMRDLLTSALDGETCNRITAGEAVEYIQQSMLSHQVNIPTVLSPGSPASVATGDLLTIPSSLPPSPEDMMLCVEVPKRDVKKQLRRKLRRNSSAPYQRQTSVSHVAQNEVVEETDDSALPDFIGLGLDC